MTLHFYWTGDHAMVSGKAFLVEPSKKRADISAGQTRLIDGNTLISSETFDFLFEILFSVNSVFSVIQT